MTHAHFPPSPPCLSRRQTFVDLPPKTLTPAALASAITVCIGHHLKLALLGDHRGAGGRDQGISTWMCCAHCVCGGIDVQATTMHRPDLQQSRVGLDPGNSRPTKLALLLSATRQLTDRGRCGHSTHDVERRRTVSSGRLATCTCYLQLSGSPFKADTCTLAIWTAAPFAPFARCRRSAFWRAMASRSHFAIATRSALVIRS